MRKIARKRPKIKSRKYYKWREARNKMQAASRRKNRKRR